MTDSKVSLDRAHQYLNSKTLSHGVTTRGNSQDPRTDFYKEVYSEHSKFIEKSRKHVFSRLVTPGIRKCGPLVQSVNEFYLSFRQDPRDFFEFFSIGPIFNLVRANDRYKNFPKDVFFIFS